jgi:hypothetical protein
VAGLALPIPDALLEGCLPNDLPARHPANLAVIMA